MIDGNTLYVLPEIEANQFDAVVTSPTYANRYDYTRTYALELAYLGVDEEIFDLRQSQLSCTVDRTEDVIKGIITRRIQSKVTTAKNCNSKMVEYSNMEVSQTWHSMTKTTKS